MGFMNVIRISMNSGWQGGLSLASLYAVAFVAMTYPAAWFLRSRRTLRVVSTDR
jgi:hypothetical protein